MIIPANIDCKTDDALNSVFYLDGKRFSGFDAQAYLRDECGFSDPEAIAYLMLLASEVWV